MDVQVHIIPAAIESGLRYRTERIDHKRKKGGNCSRPLSVCCKTSGWNSIDQKDNVEFLQEAILAGEVEQSIGIFVEDQWIGAEVVPIAAIGLNNHRIRAGSRMALGLAHGFHVADD